MPERTFPQNERALNVGPNVVRGTDGSRIFNGFITENERSADLTGTQKYTTYANLVSNVNIIAAGLRVTLNLVSKPAWSAEPANPENPRAVELAEEVEKILFDEMRTPFHRIVRQAALFTFFGFSVHEWTGRIREDGSFGFLDIQRRTQKSIERWDVMADGEVVGVVQRAPQSSEYIYLPRWKLLYLVDDSINDSPEGMGILRHVADAARRLRKFEQLEGIGFQTDLQGIPVLRGPFAELTPSDASGSDPDATRRAEIVSRLESFIDNHNRGESMGLLLDSVTYTTSDDQNKPSTTYKYDVDLLSGGSTSFEEIAAAISRLQHEIARVMGVEHLLLGSDGVGSLALSRDKSSTFGLIVAKTIKELRETFQKDLVRTIFERNGWPMELAPRLKTEAIEHRTIEEVTAALRDLSAAGVKLSREDELVQEVIDLLGMQRLDPSIQPAPVVPGGDLREERPGNPDKDEEDADDGVDE